MDEVLRETIPDALHHHGRAATYGALAGLIGGGPRNAMKTARQGEMCSWIVSSASHRPTNYPPHRIDARLADSVTRHGVLDSPEKLTAWLEQAGVDTE